MPVDTQHPLYTLNAISWQRCRDAYDGEDAVKAAGEKYLPKIDPSQTKKEYDAYKMRASYYEAVARTIDGFVGAISRKDHVIKLPAAIEAMEEDATANGRGLPDLIKWLCGETLLAGRGGVLVDFDDDQQRPYLAVYRAEAIINWSADQVVLSETVYEPDPADSFKQVAIQQLRHLHLDQGAYRVTIWRKRATAGMAQQWAPYSTLTPTSRGTPLATIPWFWLSSMGRTDAIPKPPLLGLVNLSLSHYRSSADLEHGRHFTGLPTLWISGAPDTGDSISIGSGAVIQLPDPSARAGYAEFTGQGLGSLEKALENKEHQMAQLGAMVLSSQRKGVEAAETARIRVSGESSLLMSAVSAVEDCLTSALEFAAQWVSGASGSVELKLNRDFIDQQIQPLTLTGLVAAYQAGAISLETFLFNLDQAEMLTPGTDIEDEAAALTEAANRKAAKAAKAASLAQAAEQPNAKPTNSTTPAGGRNNP